MTIPNNPHRLHPWYGNTTVRHIEQATPPRRAEIEQPGSGWLTAGFILAAIYIALQYFRFFLS